jgi:hypothetical protein
MQLPGKQQTHEVLGVTAIGLHSIPARARDLARRGDHARHPAPRELTRQAVPRRAGVGLRVLGVQLGKADLIVGTSAGAVAGAQLAGGTLERAVAMYLADEFPRVRTPVTTDEFIAAAVRAGAEASTWRRQSGGWRTSSRSPASSYPRTR